MRVERHAVVDPGGSPAMTATAKPVKYSHKKMAAE